MNNIEKAVTILGGIVLIFGAGAGWSDLNNKIENGLKHVGKEIDQMKEANSQAPCLQILTRRVATIEKGLTESEAKLEKLTKDYGCMPTKKTVTAASQIGGDDLDISGSNFNTTFEPALAKVDMYQELQNNLRVIDAQINAATFEPEK